MVIVSCVGRDRGNGAIYLCSELVGENLDCVTDEETGPSAIVEDVVNEDKRHFSITSSMDLCLHKFSCADCPDHESEAHSTCSEKEQRSPSELVDNETHAERSEEVDDVQYTIDL